MPTYLSPGIYFEEPASSAILVTAAPSDVGAMVGTSLKGPPNRPVRITSLDQFIKAFGTYLIGSYLAHAVRHFFENGGQVLWVSRVVGASGTVAASLQLQNVTPSNDILVSAFSVGSHGNQITIQPLQINTQVAVVATNIPFSAQTSAVLSDVRQVYIGATLKLANGANVLRVVVQRIDQLAKTIFFASATPTAAITAAGSTVTLEEWSLSVFRSGVIAETIPANGGMAMDPTAGSKYFKNIVNNNDPFREIVITTDNLLTPTNTVDPRPATAAVPIALTAGADGAAVADTDIVGTSSGASGFYAYDALTEPSMLAAPGWCTVTAQQGLITYVEGRITTKMLGIMAVPSGNTPAAAQTYVQTTAALYSAQASIYYPWVQQIDPSFAGTPAVQTLFPPEGMVMGVTARTTRQFGVQRAAAGTEKGRIAVAVTVERKLLQADTDLLNPLGINCIRAIDGRGICIMGARTLAKGDFLYTNVRRVFNQIEASLRGSFDVVQFESSDETLWARVERGLTSFLVNAWKAKQLKGKTAAAAFTVKCDVTNNPPSVQAAGQLVCDIALAVANPAEFVIFRLTRDQREAQAELAQAGL